MKGLLFTYLMTFGGAGLALVHPFYGLLVYISFSILKPESMWFWSVPQGNYSRIVALAVLVGWALHGFGNWKLGRARGIVLSLLAFWGWSVVSAIAAPDQEMAWGFVEGMSKIFLPFLVGITTIDSLSKLKQLAWVIALSQSYVALEFNLSYLDGYNRLFFEGLGGFDNNCLAISLVASAGLTFYLMLCTSSNWARAIALGGIAVQVHAILFSFSRGGMLALVIMGLVAFLLLPKKTSYILMFLAVGLLGWALAGKEVTDRFFQAFSGEEDRDTSAQSRLELWKACWQSMCNHPLGIGPDHWPLVAHTYGFTAGKEAHSLWFQTGAELGFPGLTFLMLFYGLTIWNLLGFTRIGPGGNPWIQGLAQMTISALIGYIVAVQFVSTETLEAPYYIVLLGAGVLKLATAEKKGFRT